MMRESGERGYSADRIRRTLRAYLSPRLVEDFLRELRGEAPAGDRPERPAARPKPTELDRARAKRLARRIGLHVEDGG